MHSGPKDMAEQHNRMESKPIISAYPVAIVEQMAATTLVKLLLDLATVMTLPRHAIPIHEFDSLLIHGHNVLPAGRGII
jgi:hypothetical protein